MADAEGGDVVGDGGHAVEAEPGVQPNAVGGLRVYLFHAW